MAIPSRTRKTDVVTDFRRTQILDAARRRFTARGLAGTTIEEIARTAGVAKGTVYLYYRSKDEVVLQLVARDLADLQHGTIPAILEPGALEARITRFLAATLDFVDRNQGFLDNCHFEMSADLRAKTRQRYERVIFAQRQAWERALGDPAAGRPGLDVSTAATAIVALAQGVAKQRLRGWISGPIDDVARAVGAVALNGVAPR